MIRRDFIACGAAAALSGRHVLSSSVRSSVGARMIVGADEQDMTEYTASDYVQDGLLTQFDAIENVGYGERDNTSNRWYDLKSGAYVSLPEGSMWGDRFLLLPNMSYYSSTVFPYRFNHFYETGQISQFLTHETLSLADTTGGMIYLFSGSGGGVSIQPAWGIMAILNNICSYGGASQTAYTGAAGGITAAESRAMVEVAGWLNPENEAYANGFTRLNGRIVASWEDGLKMPGGIVGCTSWIYYQCQKTSWARIFMRGSNELWKSYLVYDRVLTDDERAWNLKVSKARFGV